MINLAGYKDGTVDFNSSGYPVGTSVASVADADGAMTGERCAQVVRAVLPGINVGYGPSSYSSTDDYICGASDWLVIPPEWCSCYRQLWGYLEWSDSPPGYRNFAFRVTDGYTAIGNP